MHLSSTALWIITWSFTQRSLVFWLFVLVSCTQQPNGAKLPGNCVIRNFTGSQSCAESSIPAPRVETCVTFTRGPTGWRHQFLLPQPGRALPRPRQRLSVIALKTPDCPSKFFYNKIHPSLFIKLFFRRQRIPIGLGSFNSHSWLESLAPPTPRFTPRFPSPISKIL